MAFTDSQKASIRFYLGYQERFIFMNSVLETQLEDDVLSDETVSIVTGILGSLADIETALASAQSRLKALKVGSIELPGKGEIVALCAEGSRFVGQLASVFGVPALAKVFAYGGSGAGGGMFQLG